MSQYYQLVRHRGNQDLFRVVEMSVAALLNDSPFHIQVEGMRGTGKTTIMRAARELLPPIKRIKDCLYNCDPAQPHCPIHHFLSPEEVKAIGVEEVPRPFLEISQSAKVGSVVGSIDLAKLTDPINPLAALLPGTIPQAHRGVIFIDEINRLVDTAPELADVLLDVMGTRPGRIQIEETGIQVVDLPVSVSIWAASNPDEDPGPLSRIRKQLADRFDLTVAMGRPDDYQDVVDILASRNRAFLPGATLGQRGGTLADCIVGQELRQALAQIYIDFSLESLRAVQAMEMASRLTAIISGRTSVTIADLVQVAPFALSHRAKDEVITEIIAYLNGLLQATVQEQAQPADNKPPLSIQAVSRWKEFCTALRMWLSAMLAKWPQLPYSGNGGGGGSGQGAGTRIIDPLDTIIIAPPKEAKPITSLPDEQLVTRERNINPNG
ncbi:MAG: Cob-chelat-sub: cobaltochelatase subunit [Sporomusa sp.]|jgi:magnesium chelatase subunit I|nr:Cob-chelat-sub: cobaltochelatase subunit [Sporomusa sp.]